MNNLSGILSNSLRTVNPDCTKAVEVAKYPGSKPLTRTATVLLNGRFGSSVGSASLSFQPLPTIVSSNLASLICSRVGPTLENIPKEKNSGYLSSRDLPHRKDANVAKIAPNINTPKTDRSDGTVK